MVPKPTNAESRIHGYDYNSYIKAASCVVALGSLCKSLFEEV